MATYIECWEQDRLKRVRRGWFLALDPVPRAAGTIRRAEPLGHDASEAKLTRLATAELVNIIGGYGYRPALIIHAGVHRRGLPRRKNPARRLAAAAGLFSSIIRVSHYKGRLGPIGIRCLLPSSSRSGAYRPG
jgi:hypothetical protein